MPKRKGLYTCRYIDIQGNLIINNREVLLSVHAIKQARKRDIFPDMVEATINGGKIKRFGKNLLKITKPFKNQAVACIGEIVGEIIIIKTVEWCKK